MQYYIIPNFNSLSAQVYTTGEFIKALSNANMSRFWDYYPIFGRLYTLQTKSIPDWLNIHEANLTPLSRKTIANFRIASSNWLNHVAPHRYQDSSRLNYMRQSNLLGKAVATINLYQPYYGKSKRGVVAKSHSTYGMRWRHQRAGKEIHASSAKAAAVYNSYQDLPHVRHRNRHQDSTFYAWDDKAYERSRQSAGWKQRKNRHQWEAKIKQKEKRLKQIRR